MALSQRISIVPSMARAHGNVATGIAHRIYAALASTWVLTLIFETSLMIRALGVVHALSSDASCQGVPEIPSMARANRPLLVSPVVTRLALGIRTAWVGLAEILFSERATAYEGIASHVPWAGADRGYAASQLAVGVYAANTLAGVLAGIVEAGGLARGTVAVLGALGLA